MGPFGDLPDVDGVDHAVDHVERLHAWLAGHPGCEYGKAADHSLRITDADGNVIAEAFTLRSLLRKIGAPLALPALPDLTENGGLRW